MTDKHLDDAIDRAVRGMMNVDADPAFRARVFSRLEREPRGGASWWRVIALAGAVTAAVFLAVALMRTFAPAPAEKQVASVQAAPANAPAPQVPVSSRASQLPQPASQLPQVASAGNAGSAPPRRSRRPDVAGIEMPNVTHSLRAGSLVATVADPQSEGSGAATSDETLDPITVHPLQPAPIVPSPIVIAPLPPIAAIEIAPLSPQMRRD